MIVCVCKRVSDREIARHASAGMDFDDIQLMLGVATQCGRCEGCARDVIEKHRAAAAHYMHQPAPPVLGSRVFPILSAA
ncbi:MAG: ferredoxin [Curvibacter sp. GWA2_64_110]|nr:MAG: ferredoxin [Curvibacter sp. GWA2_64_110]HCY17000.1 ferredoxin [Curvibacter sp.]